MIHDNEQRLAPTLDKLNAVTAILEKNRDNIAKALPGLAKFQTTLGETIGNGPYYQAYVPNLDIAQILQPCWITRSGSAGAQTPVSRPTTPGLAPSFPSRTTEFPDPGSSGVRRDDSQPATETRTCGGAGGRGLVGGVAVVVQQTFFRPKTITAYFTTATAIYPGDEVRIAGVKVGTIDSIEPVGTQAKMTLHVDRGIRVPADAKAVIVAQNLVSARYVQLAPAYESGPTMRTAR